MAGFIGVVVSIKDYERLQADCVRAASRSETFIHIAMIRMMLRRLA